MEYKGSLIDCGSEAHAKAQRRKETRVFCRYLTITHGDGPFRVRFFFAPLRLCAMVFLFISTAFVCLAQPRGLMRPADIVRIANVTDAQISPNGQFVVYTVSTVVEDKVVSTLWIARLSFEITPVQPTAQPTPRARGSRTVPEFEWPDIRVAPRTLMPSGISASNPRWSPDGNSIAFLSEQDEQDGLWVVRLDKPEPRFIAPITSTNFFITYAGEPFSWSPVS